MWSFPRTLLASSFRSQSKPWNVTSIQSKKSSFCFIRHRQNYTHAAPTKKINAVQQTSFYHRVYNAIKANPIEFLTIPTVAAFVGISTNYMGVQMLFYPLEYQGSSIKRFPDAPYGIFGWQGVVPARTEKMALRLVDIVTRDLLSLREAFGNLDANVFADLMTDVVVQAVKDDCGTYWAIVLKPLLPMILTRVVRQLQVEIDEVLDLPTVVLNAFVRDKVVLVELFQKVGRVELKFLIESGFGFGFILGLAQMVLWAVKPKAWTLPVAGSLVGYVTNWIAIKLLFEPADPVELGPLTVQGLFESRQKEVSEEFAHFMESRVLSSPMLLDALANQNEHELFEFLRRQLPYPIPEKVLRAAIKAIRNVASNPEEHEQIHQYVREHLDIEDTLSRRLKKLSPKSFENLLHPVFQEDEIILIVVGGVLGALAGLLQTRVTFSGSNARAKSIGLLLSSLMASAGFFVLSDYSDFFVSGASKDVGYDPVIDKRYAEDTIGNVHHHKDTTD
mmetsp:Transcript_5677/g.10764  ORF Transcript_5677/g.10764 Transcript_5677/m.10764 type:complete len:504 (+) Transcript_5677:234-1745(+)|eukprot:CAMPEP_0176504530 /NCGR_PEP_ID=MMETSP0200_2-20121128/15988_1 /TAXON_ID=947934 /ORGANISM="Chaetoceros sp., Strain GSL56" /LENGTH=503 /DNA_ID=CAMNT_0017903979 /DNA_START=118 /DNA_END=1629 /DNA_ORIENTATION=-